MAAPKKAIKRARKAVEKAPVPLPGDIQKKIVELSKLRAAAADLGDQVSTLQDEIVTAFRAAKEDKLLARDGDIAVQATLVQRVSEVINEDKLKQRLGAPLWNKITRNVLDKKKLDNAIKDGDISITIVAEVSETKTSNPFIKTTVRG